MARRHLGMTQKEFAGRFGFSLGTLRNGAYALCNLSRRPVRYANQLPEPIERLIVATKHEKRRRGKDDRQI